MPAYARFIDPFGGGVFVGGLTVGRYAGWTKLTAIDLVTSPSAGPQGRRGQGQYVITRVEHSATAKLYEYCTKGTHIGVTLDLTSADGKGGERTELSVALHDVVVETDSRSLARVGSGLVAYEGFRLRYQKMTYSNMPVSSPDVSPVLKTVLRGGNNAASMASRTTIAR